jgi:hypothetical protein
MEGCPSILFSILLARSSQKMVKNAHFVRILLIIAHKITLIAVRLNQQPQ